MFIIGQANNLAKEYLNFKLYSVLTYKEQTCTRPGCF